MNQKNITLALLGGAVAALLVAVILLMQKIDRQTALIGTLNARIPAAQTLPPAQTPSLPAVPSPSAVLTPGLPTVLAPGGGVQSPAARAPLAGQNSAEWQAKAAALNELQKEFKALTINPDGKPVAEVDMDKLDALLVRLIATQGGSVIAGVDMQALRQNLAVAKKMQELGKALEAENRQPKPDPAKINAMMAELKSLQRSMQMNVMPSAAPSPPFSPPSAESAGAGK